MLRNRGILGNLGAPAARLRAAVARSSAQQGGTFINREPTGIGTVSPAMLWKFATRGRKGAPPQPVPVRRPVWPAAPDALAVTWLGHATAVIELDGRRILTDPVLGQRVSPLPFAGPKRLHPAPVTVAGLPDVDVVLISHDHYDHLERSTIRELADRTRAQFVVPIGVGEHLRFWGVPAERIVELDRRESARVAGIRFTAEEARHFSGRFLARNPTLWTSWVIEGPEYRVFFAGDSGYGRHFLDMAARHRPFDLTLMPIGAYDDTWHDIHLDPEEALQANLDLGGGPVLPIHWATFDLAFHSWGEPIERFRRAAERTGTHWLAPMVGERIELAALRADTGDPTPWWGTAA